MSKHTPGPWIWDEPSNWMGLHARVCTEKYEPIAQVQISGWPKRIGRANVKLIAAAPDLLEACQEVLKGTQQMGSDWSDRINELLNAAIAKATS